MKTFLKNYSGIFFSSLFAAYTIYEKFMLPELQLPMLISIIFAAILFIFFKTKPIISKTEFSSKISYAIFAFLMVAGDSFKKYGSFFGVFGNPFKNSDIAEKLFEDFASMFGFLNGPAGNALMVLSSVSKGIGYYFIIKYTFELAKYLFKKLCSSSEKNERSKAFLDKIFDKNAFVKVFLILVIAWLPYLVIKFPCAVSSDALTQINQVLQNKLTTHHPFFTALLYGGFSKLGLLLGNINIGLFLLIIIQYIFMALSFSWCICSMDKLGKNHVFSFALVLMFSISPSFPSYATTVVKDALYSTFFVLYITQFILTIHNIKNDCPFRRNIISLSIISVFVCLTRNNGIYAVAPTMIFFSIYFLFKKEETATHRLSAIICLLLPLVFYSGYDFLQYDILKLEKGSIREALSIPFQQTARYVREHPEDVSADDAQVIDKVLNYKKLGELYNPVVSDPVKATYKGNSDALNDYFKVWFKHLKKHPVTYIEATVNTAYFAFYPDEPNIRAYSVMGNSAHNNAVRKALKILLLAYTMLLSAIPFLGCLINPVFFVWIFIHLLIKFLFNRKYLKALIMLPMLMQILSVIAGPAVFNHPRYIYPIYWSVPFMVAYLLTISEQTGSSEDKVSALSS